MLKIFLIVPLLLLFTSCEYISTEGEVNNNTKYPSKVGYEWEYNTTQRIEFYDTSGHIDSTSFKNLGNTIVRITKIKDIVGTYSNLIRFDSYDVATPQNIHQMWYLHRDSGLIAIAYSNPGASQPIFPKQKASNTEQIKNLIQSFGLFPSSNSFYGQTSLVSDSIQYYSPQRIVLSYPLRIGSRWIELTQPFFRERFIQKRQIINANNRNYNCYKLESNMGWIKLEYNDYIDLSSGLIQRELIADSLMITTTINPDSGRYGNIIQISKLVRQRI